MVEEERVGGEEGGGREEGREGGRGGRRGREEREGGEGGRRGKGGGEGGEVREKTVRRGGIRMRRRREWEQ